MLTHYNTAQHGGHRNTATEQPCVIGHAAAGPKMTPEVTMAAGGMWQEIGRLRTLPMTPLQA
jgi:hypothetical protein